MFQLLAPLAHLVTRAAPYVRSFAGPRVASQTAAEGVLSHSAVNATAVAGIGGTAGTVASAHFANANSSGTSEQAAAPTAKLFAQAPQGSTTPTNVFEKLVVPIGPLGLLSAMRTVARDFPFDFGAQRFVSGNAAQQTHNGGYVSHPSNPEPLVGGGLDPRWLAPSKEEYLSDPAKPLILSGTPLRKKNGQPGGYEAYVPNASDFLHLSSLPPNANTLIVGNGGYTRPFATVAGEFFPSGTVYVTTRGRIDNAGGGGGTSGVQYIPITHLTDVTPELLNQVKPQVIFPVVNYFGSNLQKAIDTNVIGMRHLVETTNEYAKTNPGKNVVFIVPSSHSVWKEGYGLTELSPPNGTSPYATTKAMSENLARMTHQPNLAISTVRLPSTIGAMRKDAGTLVHGYIAQGINSGKITIFERPDSMRPYGDSLDTSRQILNIASHPDSRVTEDLYVLAPKGGGTYTAQEVADAIQKVFQKHGKHVEINFSSEQEPLGGHRSFSVSPDLYWGRFNSNQPTNSLTDSIERVFLHLGGARSPKN